MDTPRVEHTPGQQYRNGYHAAATIDPDELQEWAADPDIIKAARDIKLYKFEQEHPDAPKRATIRTRRALNIRTTQWPDPVWIVPGLLPAGLTKLGGLPKLGKSWLSLQLSRAVSAGDTIFGVKAPRGKVWYLALEDPYRRLADRMSKQGWPDDDLDVDFTTIDEGATDIGDVRKGGIQRILDQIAAGGYRLTIIDTVNRIITGDQKERHEIAPILEPLQVGAQKMGVGIILVDHHRKSVGNAAGEGMNDTLMDSEGSVAKAGTIDTGWDLYRKRGEIDGKLTITGRDVEEQTFKLRFDKESFIWISEGNAAQLEMTQRRQEIIDALTALGQSTCTAIAKHVDQPTSNTSTRLADLVVAGMITKSGNLYELRK
jgi:RecA-family ATPase